jgi:hypothetical protein
MTSPATSLGETDDLENTNLPNPTHRFCYLRLNLAQNITFQGLAFQPDAAVG